jgi:hypothetical protein
MEKRIKSLEMITERLMRRSTKHTVGLITPYPISNAVFGDGIKGPVLRYMFPCSGVVSKGLVKLGSKPKVPVMLFIKVFNEQKSEAKGIAIDKRFFSIEPNLSVSAGDCLEVVLEPSDEVVTEIWLSFLWKPEMKDVEAKSFLIEELENDLLKKKALTAE